MTRAGALAGSALALALSLCSAALAPRAAPAETLSETPPPARAVAQPAEPRPTEPPPARAGQGVVPEPEGYHGEPYRAPVPATLRGAEVVDDAAAHALWRAGIPFLDLLPTPVRPANLPPGTLWRDPPHETIPGAIWLANTGYDALDPETEAYFRAALARVSDGRKDAPLCSSASRTAGCPGTARNGRWRRGIRASSGIRAAPTAGPRGAARSRRSSPTRSPRHRRASPARSARVRYSRKMLFRRI